MSVVKAERNWRSEESFDIRHGDADLEFAQLIFSLALVQYSVTMLPFLLFRMVTHTLCYCKMEVCNLFFEFTGVTVKRVPLLRIVLGLFKQC